jgi:hypothetical protein
MDPDSNWLGHGLLEIARPTAQDLGAGDMIGIGILYRRPQLLLLDRARLEEVVPRVDTLRG